jgi:hypothetical protein
MKAENKQIPKSFPHKYHLGEVSRLLLLVDKPLGVSMDSVGMA